MEPMYYIGLDIHKRKISYCVKDSSGRIDSEGWIPATRFDLDRWMKSLPQPWSAAMEATMFTGWIYDPLKPHAAALKVAHPLMLRAIVLAKKKNDCVDARKICDSLRCDFLPECYMAPTAIRERRCILRYRNLLVRQMVQMKIKISTLLMEAGVVYNKQRLHKADYFRELLATNPQVDAGLRSLLRQCREMVVRLGKTENALIRSLQHDRLLTERVERLMSIPAIGPITALTWALEVGEVQRLSSIKKAVSYNTQTGRSTVAGRGYNTNVYTGNTYGYRGGATYNPNTGIVAGGGAGYAGNIYSGQGSANRGGFAYNTNTNTGIAAGKNNIYAGKDGTVYRYNRDSGNWSSNSGNGWQNVDKPQPKLQSEQRARTQGAQRSQNFRSTRPSGGARMGGGRRR